MALKIAIVVHGRFHAFDLAREVLHQGHEVIVVTNYPARIVERFGISKQHVRSLLLHGVLSRLSHRLQQLRLCPDLEPLLHNWFSKWAAATLQQQESFDAIHCFSGVAEDVLAAPFSTKVIKSLVRGSAHIQVQSRLLEEEAQRAGISIDKPSKWMIEREEREYQLADVIFVLSTFAQNSFRRAEINPAKLRVLPLGTQLNLFYASPETIAERCDRILLQQPLRVLMVGTFSLRKGAIDFVEIASALQSNFCFKFVGTVGEDAKFLLKKASSSIEFIPKQPQHDLPSLYNWADLFIFTTIEDGYAVVLTQAHAAGLPILATTNCAAPDIIRDNETGWILPIRNAEAFIERLEWCHEHRLELTQMVRRVHENLQQRDWSDVATNLIKVFTDIKANQATWTK